MAKEKETLLKTRLGKELDFLKVTVEIGGLTFEEDLAIQAMIDPNIDALNEALATNPGKYAKWAMLEAKARAQHDAAVGALATQDVVVKTELDARLFIKWQQALTSPDSKAPTLDSIKSRVAQDPDMLEAVKLRQSLADQVQEAKASLEYLAVGRKTIEQKRDSLLALATNWRHEMERGLSVARTRQSDLKPGPSGVALPQGRRR